VIAGSLAITVLAFGIDGLLALVQRAATPRPLRKQTRFSRTAATVAQPTQDDLVIQQP
jgi:hypothetical protein